jgi:predicted acyl esterase
MRHCRRVDAGRLLRAVQLVLLCRNTNSGHPILANDSEADIRVATNVIHHAAATPSFLELPVVG